MHGRRREWLISLDRPWLGPDRSYSLKLKGWAATPHKKDGTAQQMTGPLKPTNFKAIRRHESLAWTRKRYYLFILVRSQRCRHLNFEQLVSTTTYINTVWTSLNYPCVTPSSKTYSPMCYWRDIRARQLWLRVESVDLSTVAQAVATIVLP